ncbi:MAG: septal ring lytic transglycosylase RlpA family protein [Alphaproteobacteria bacterium]|nr:septal ring lytic transglycosylase RlpA family protein [Alphaproteobacteria bacterium]
MCRNILTLLCLICMPLLMAGCTEVELASHLAKNIPGGPPQSEGTFKVGTPYKVEGKWYKPQETYSHTETGIASWYGSDFHGKKTANGEIFDMNELTAAHRTLQLPSLIRVTNLENGRSLIVRVNDRGPFKRGRVLDMSKKGAELLGFKNKGTAKVKIQLLSEESRAIAQAARRGQDTSGVEIAMNENRFDPRLQTGRASSGAPSASQSAPPRQVPIQPVEIQPQISAPPSAEVEVASVPGHTGSAGNFYPDPVVQQLPVSPTSIYVQAASFGDRSNAQRLAMNLQPFGQAKVYPAMVNGRQFYRVRFGPMGDVAQADALLERLAGGGHNEPIIVVD